MSQAVSFPRGGRHAFGRRKWLSRSGPRAAIVKKDLLLTNDGISKDSMLGIDFISDIEPGVFITVLHLRLPH